MWYRRPDALRRYTYFFNSTTLAGAFGGLIAYGTGYMQGMRGYGAWRWLFIIEGAVTCFVAVLAWFLISDFPEQARWLTEAERRWMKKRMEVEHGTESAEDPIRFTDVVEVLKDYRICLGALIYFSFLVPSYVCASFANLKYHSDYHIVLRILFTDNHQILRLQHTPDSTAFRPSFSNGLFSLSWDCICL